MAENFWYASFRKNRGHSGLCAGLVSLALVFAGCGGETGPKRYHVSGNVTFNGTPVPYGSIQFQPDLSKGNSGPAGYATILNGKYSTADGGKGMVAGPHQVIIIGQKGPPQEVTNPDEPVHNDLFPQHTQMEDFKKEETVLNIDVPTIAP